MSDLYEKLAGNGNAVSRRLMDVSKELAEGPGRRPGLFSSRSSVPSWFARLSTALGGAAAEKAPAVARGAGKAVAAPVDLALRTGDQSLFAPAYQAGADIAARNATLPNVLLGGAGLSVLMAADRASMNSETVAPLAQAQATGENLMTDPFTSFVQKRAAEKTASFRRLTGAAAEGLEGLIKNMSSGKGVSAGQAIAMGAGGVGLGAGLDALSGGNSVGSGIEYQLAKKFIPIDDRIQATDTAAEAFLSQGGKNVANLLDDAIREGVNVGASAAVHHNRSFDQDIQFQNAVQSDPLLSQATPEEKEMLRRSFNSMSRFSPDLATDEFAVKNFLRESMMASNGPDYATLGNMARVNEHIAPSALLPQKTKAPI